LTNHATPKDEFQTPLIKESQMNALKVRKWDSAEHLKTEEDIELYFEVCLQEAGDDAAFLAKALEMTKKATKTLTHEQMVNKMLKNPAVKVEVEKLNRKEFAILD
jgi:hypothetical protein